MQQQFARAHRIQIGELRCLGQRADMRADQKELAVLDHDIAFLDLRSARAQRLDFPAFEHETGLVALFDEVIEEGFSVVDDAHEWKVPNSFKITILAARRRAFELLPLYLARCRPIQPPLRPIWQTSRKPY